MSMSAKAPLAVLGILAVGALAASAQRPKPAAPGVREAADPRSIVVRSEVEGLTTIILLLPEGTEVEKGDLVCELDSANLRDDLTNQAIAASRAQADFYQAQKTLEVTEIARAEYLQGTFELERQELAIQVKLAQQEFLLAQEELEEAEKGGAGLALKRAERNLSKAEFALRQAEPKLNVFMKYTLHKRTKELEVNIEKAKSDMLAKEATYKLEESKRAKLERQIERCKLYAPADGIVVRVNQSDTGRSLEEGDTVRERQAVFRIVVPVPREAAK
jgi:multidrug resistance efflux pump